jgi:stalled ribosome rescue protein Dom34
MPNKNYPQERAEMINQIQAQSAKILFLSDMIKDCKNTGFIAPDVEMDFNEQGFSEIIKRIKKKHIDTDTQILSEQMSVEENILKNLSKQAFKD